MARRVLSGAVTVCMGLVLTVLSFSVHQEWTIQRFWPLLVVVFGVVRIVEQERRIEGWVLLLVGGAVLLSNLGLFELPGSEVVRYWPVAVVLAGISELVLFEGLGAKGEGAAVVFLGVWLQLSYFGAVPVSSYRAWPLAVVAVGGLMLWRGRYSTAWRAHI